MLLLSRWRLLISNGTTRISTLSLHDALPIYGSCCRGQLHAERKLANPRGSRCGLGRQGLPSKRSSKRSDRKSTRLNSSHLVISYAVFCLKKKNNTSCKMEMIIFKWEETLLKD